MKLYKVRYRDQAGYRQQFFGNQKDARDFSEALKERINHPKHFNRIESVEEIEKVDIPTDKHGLIQWLNINNANADGF